MIIDTRSKVSLVKGNDRYENIKKALHFIEKDIENNIKKSKKIVIKPNYTSDRIKIATTHHDSVKAVLDFITQFTNKKIIIAEGFGTGVKEETFEKFGYRELTRNYNIEFINLNKDEYSVFDVYDSKLNSMKVRVAKTITGSDCIISLAVPKTHDTVIATLTLKNIIMGSLIKDEMSTVRKGLVKLSRCIPSRIAMKIRNTSIANFGCSGNDKARMHQGYKAINKSLFKLATLIKPHIGILDGFVSMEGNGPIFGTPIETKTAIVGTDFLAVDSIGTYLMGFDINDIGYLYYCKKHGLGIADLKNIDILSNAKLNDCRKVFKPHYLYNKQLRWK